MEGRTVGTAVVALAVGIWTIVTPVADMGAHPWKAAPLVVSYFPTQLAVPYTVSTSTDGASVGIDGALAQANNYYVAAASTG